MCLCIQDGSSHYLKGLMLGLAYVVIGACFFVQKVPSGKCFIYITSLLFNYLLLININIISN